MEKHHRDAIQKNYLALVQHCNIDALLPVLVQKKVFSSDMIRKYLTGTDYLKKRRDLFLDIQMRGPDAFINLVAALHETHQSALGNLLQPPMNNNAEPRGHAKPFLLPTNEEIPALDAQEIQHLGQDNVGTINLGTEPLRIHVQPATSLHDDPRTTRGPVYSTHSKNRGYALIINNIKYINNCHPERRGAEVDGKNLEDLFRQVGLRVEYFADLTGAQMEQTILTFKSSPKLKGVDMVFVIVMGHGNQNVDLTTTDIIGIDNKHVTTLWIQEQFNNVHCKVLQKIPKIIMYQTCRGLIPDFGVALRTENDSGANNITLSTCSDMLITYSTLPGTLSHRDIYLGTWYINLFCEVVMTHAKDMHIEEIFKMVNNKLSSLRSAQRTMQTSLFYNIGFKSCYLHPQIYMEDGLIKNIHDDS